MKTGKQIREDFEILLDGAHSEELVEAIIKNPYNAFKISEFMGLEIQRKIAQLQILNLEMASIIEKSK